MGNNKILEQSQKRELLKKLEDDFFYLKNVWEEYKKLFSKEDTIEEINKYCGGCFQIIQLAMNNEIIITINRLLDRKKSGSNTNIVLETLQHFLSDKNKTIFITNLEEIRKYIKECGFKETRNKRLAHRDIKQESSFLLIDYDCIDNSIIKIEELFKFFREHAQLNYLEYSTFITSPGCENLIEAINFFNKNYFKGK